MPRISYIVELSTGQYFDASQENIDQSAKILENALGEILPEARPTVLLFGVVED